MAEGKKSFVLYSDLILVVKKLIDKDRKNKTNNTGELFYHLLQYVSDENPEPINDTIDLVFEPIKNQLKRDLNKWESRSDRSRENGKLGGRPKKEDNPKQPEETQQVILKPKEPDTVNVIVCNNMLDDNVNANANDILLKKEAKEDSIVISDELKIHPPTEKIDFNQLQKFFNDNRGLLPEVKKITEARKLKLKTIEKEYGKELIKIAIEKVRDSPFLQGDNNKNWIASFDWVFTKANFIKILEDNYAKRANKSERTNEQIFTDSMQSETAKNFRFK